MDKYNLEWVLAHDEKYRYQLLSRMQMDCNAFLGISNRRGSEAGLWAGNIKEHIEYMKALWNSFPPEKKPEWLTWEQIEKYEGDMERNKK